MMSVNILVRIVVYICMALVVSCSEVYEPAAATADIIMTVSHEDVYLRYGPYGDEPVECMLVMDEDCPGVWRPMLADAIDGFDFVPGVECSLRVRRTLVSHPYTGEDCSEYQLVEVLHAETVE